MKQMSFQNKLIASIVVISVFSIGALAAVSYSVAKEKLLVQQRHNLRNSVHKTLDEMSFWMEDRMRDVILFSENGVFQAAVMENRMDEAEARLKRLYELSKFYENIFITDTDATVLMDSLSGQSAGMELKDIPGFRENLEAARRGETASGYVQLSPVTGRPVVVMTAPIVFEGRYIGIIGTALDLITFANDYIRNIHIGESGYLFMADADGRIILHPDTDRILKQNLSDLGLDNTITARDELAFFSGGEKRIGHVMTYEPKGWKIIASAPESDFLEPITSMRNWMILLGISAILLLCIAAWLTTRKVFFVIKGSIEELEGMSLQIAAAADQVSISSGQLAEGSSQQAASLQQTSSTLEEMASMTQANANNARQTKAIVNESKADMDAANQAMGDLTTSMNDITDASRETQKIVKTIDDISFQTNLLALNAAVEAARAGNAGAGFAVVANEVRNLALRSTESARNTAGLIQGTVEKIENGARIVGKTDEIFTKAAQGTARIESLVEEISAASTEQASGISQVNRAVSEMDHVTHQNAASAEESASAAQELEARAQEMKGVVDRLMTLLGDRKRKELGHKFGHMPDLPASDVPITSICKKGLS